MAGSPKPARSGWWYSLRQRERAASPDLQILDSAALQTAQRAKQRPGDPDWYMPAGDKGRRAAGHGLHPKHIEAITVSVDCGDELRRTLPGRVGEFDRYIVVTASHDVLTQEVARAAGAKLVVTDACYDDHCAFNKGAMLNAGLDALEYRDWIVFSDADIFFPPDWRERIGRFVLNPGCLYYTRRWHLPREVQSPDWSLITDYHLLDPGGNDMPWGYFQLWNVRASCLRQGLGIRDWGLDSRRNSQSPIPNPQSLIPFLRGGLRFPLCFCSAGSIDHWFCIRWPRDQWVRLPTADCRYDVLHLWHGTLASRWNGHRARADQWQYAGQSDIGPEEQWRRTWPAPCLVRRVDMRSCAEETRRFDGRPIAWSTPTRPDGLYEFSMRKETPDG